MTSTATGASDKRRRVSERAWITAPATLARENMPLAAAWCFAIAAFLLFACWLAVHPAVAPSDDALFFERALTRFSVLDFSPQFPGYPGFVALGRGMRLLTGNSARALLTLTILLALGAPVAAAVIAGRVRASAQAALCAFAVTLTQPLLPDLALNMMSDGAGVFFLLAALALAPRIEAPPAAGVASAGLSSRSETISYGLVGLALGGSACCRPSDAALLIGAAAGFVLARPSAALPIAAGAALVAIPAILGLLAIEGSLYWAEGLRFVSGHAEIWGNTSFSASERAFGWSEALHAVPWSMPAVGLAVAAMTSLALRLRDSSGLFAAILCAFAGDLAWVALFQNPDHLRHLAPLALLAGLALVLAPRGAGWRAVATCVAIGANLAITASTLNGAPTQPPALQRAIDRLAQAPEGSAVASNEGVGTLRAQLTHLRVYDIFYKSDSDFGLSLAAGEAFRLSTTRIPGATPIATYAARVLGETPLILYRVIHPSGGETTPNVP